MLKKMMIITLLLLVMVSDLYARQGRRGGRKGFYVPQNLPLRNLPKAVTAYATKVKTCLHVDWKDATKGQREWMCDRDDNTECISKKERNLPIVNSVEELVHNREELCGTIFERLVDRFYCGSQYGNCGEGSDVDYCLAHRAGQTDIMHCESKNDHAFSIFLKKGSKPSEDTICLMDRWELGPEGSEGRGPGDNGYYYCDVSVIDGVISYKGKKLKGRDWYKKVTCQDYYNNSANSVVKPFRNLNVDTWRKHYLAKNNIFHPRTMEEQLGLDEYAIDKVGHEVIGKDKIKFIVQLDNKSEAKQFVEKINERETNEKSLEHMNIAENGRRVTLEMPSAKAFKQLLEVNQSVDSSISE